MITYPLNHFCHYFLAQLHQPSCSKWSTTPKAIKPASPAPPSREIKPIIFSTTLPKNIMFPGPTSSDTTIESVRSATAQVS